MMKTMCSALTVALMWALPAASTLAATGGPLPQEHHEASGVTWISGGVGKDEADAMRAIGSRYNLRLVLAEKGQPRAAFLADARVKITGPSGEVIQIRSAGPLLYLKLPPGRYTVTAEVAGHARTRLVTVKPKAAVAAAMIWPKSVG